VFNKLNMSTSTEIQAIKILPPRPFMIFNYIFDANMVCTIIPDDFGCIRIYDHHWHIIKVDNVNEAIKEAFHSWKEALK